jgi:hypothetical protein
MQMPRDLFRVAMRVDGPPAHLVRQSPQSLANESSVEACTRDLNAVIAFQGPGYPLWTKAIGLPELEDPVYGLLGQRSGVMMGYWLPGNQSGSSAFSEGSRSFIECRFRNSKLTVGFGIVAAGLSILENHPLIWHYPSFAR